MVKRIKFKKLKNTRDLGGYRTTDGKTIVSAKLIRSGHLGNAAEEDIKKLIDEYGLKLIIDLRTDMEIADAPCRDIPGVEVKFFPLLDSSFFGIARDEYSIEAWLNLFKDPSIDPDSMFSDMYFKLVFDERVKPMIKEIFESVAECDGAVLWHCSAGKDRAGVITMLLLTALGVDREVIITDYLATKRFTYGDILKIKLFGPLKLRDRALIKGANVLMSVNGDYLRRIFSYIDGNFNDKYDFFEKQYGISHECIDKIIKKYLV